MSAATSPSRPAPPVDVAVSSAKATGVRLAWVDSETGQYTSHQRRAIPPESVWRGRPSLTSQEVDHLISEEERRDCRCRLHSQSPFGFFLAREKTEIRPEAITIWREQVESTTISPPLSCLPIHMSRNTHLESGLLHHYVHYIAAFMMPVDHPCNPWKSTYPYLAVHGADLSARALYHAILAQASFNLANLQRKDHPSQSIVHRTRGTRYSTLALCELRQALTGPAADVKYTSILAALMTVTFQDIFLQSGAASSPTWKHHLRGALVFVRQFLQKQPWRNSWDAWIVTQNFSLSVVLALTGSVPRPTSEENRWSISELGDVLIDVTNLQGKPYGFTIGGTARLIRRIYDIRLVEEQLLLGNAMTSQMAALEEQLAQPADIETPVFDGEADYSEHCPSSQLLSNLHLHLFHCAVRIYWRSVVLRLPPSSVIDDVWTVLGDAVTFADLHSATVSIWPLFVAAVEAYTKAAQTLARQLFASIDNFGIQNRKDLQRVVETVWKTRNDEASRGGCDPGDVTVDWREVMVKTNVEVMLL